MQPDTNSAPAQSGSLARDPRTTAESRLLTFDKRQTELWRLTLLILFVLTAVFAWLSWGWLRLEGPHLLALPIGLVALVVLFGAYTWKKTSEISELKGLLRGLDQKDSALPSDQQLEQLFQMISKSQQGFRDLIDSFDDHLLALSLDGEIRAVNRSFAGLLGLPFQKIIGRPLSEFMEDVCGTHQADLSRGLAKFMDRRHWTGVVQVRLIGRNTTHYFECVAQAMLRDEKVHGITVLARDVTAARRNGARFTELFETLQEGIYIATPDDRVLEVNPALVRMLGYGSKEELLAKHVSDVFADEF
jgi:PAS domain S-box-containing protein